MVFQSTPLREGRLPEEMYEPHGVKVSIHAPARGATLIIAFAQVQLYSFNPRPCARGDLRKIF